MRRSVALRWFTVPSVAVASSLVFTISAAAGDEAILRLRAFAVDLNTRARTNTLDIVIERWSTPEEVADLKAVFLERGEEKLLSALQKTKPRCGFVRTPDSIGWDIFYAARSPLPDGGSRIVLASDRPVSIWEARNSPRSMDYQFSLAEIRLDKDGKGQGKAIRAAKLTLDKAAGTLEIENFQREPVRLNEVTVVDRK